MLCYPALMLTSLCKTNSYTNPIAFENLSATGHAWALAMLYTVSRWFYRT